MPVPTPAPTSSTLAPPLGRTEIEQQLLETAVCHYHEALAAHPERLGRLKWRGDRGARMLRSFQLGLGDDELVTHLAKQAPWSSSDGERRLVAHLRGLGLLRASGLETFSGTLVVPIRDELGRVLQVFGGRHFVQRKIDSDLYLPGPRRGVFNPSGCVGTETVIVTETPVDALRFWYAGYVHVTSVFGGVGPSAELAEAFRTHDVRRVLLAFGQGAGEDWKVALSDSVFRSMGLHTYRIVLDRRFAPSSRSWGLLVQGAFPLHGAPALPPLWPVAPDFDPWAEPGSSNAEKAEVSR